MAHWMRHWPVMTLVGCGLVALWLLPPDPPRELDTYVPPTEAQALKVELRAEARRLNDVLKRLTWVDSLSDVFSAAEPSESGAVISFPDGIEPDIEERFHARIAREIDRLALEDPKYTIGLARPQWGSGNHVAFGGGPTLTEFYLIEGAHRPVCLIVHPYGLNPASIWWERKWLSSAARSSALDQNRSTPPGWSDILGPCAYYAIHGTPGPAIGEWLRSGASHFGRRFAPSRRFRGTQDDDALELVFNGADRMGNRAPFGERDHAPPHRTLECLTGEIEACENLVLNARPLRLTAVNEMLPAFMNQGQQGLVYYLEGNLFYDLQDEFGREAFGRFWTSDQDVDIAFQAAFGLEIGQWVMGWAQARLGVYRMGPMPSLEAILISLGVISFFLTIAIAMGTRRKVA